MLPDWRRRVLQTRIGRFLVNLRALVRGRDFLRDDVRTTAALAENERNLQRSELVITSLIERHYGEVLLPPSELRMHVGTDTAAFGFWSKGINSSRWVLDVFGTEPPGPVLDWGCGSGRTLMWLRCHAAWREHYRGCDADADAIAWLQSRGFDQVHAVSPDPPLPYADGSLSGLFAFSVLTHVHPDLHAAWYTEIARVLSEGSRALVTLQGSVFEQARFGGSGASGPDRTGTPWVPDPSGIGFYDLSFVTEEFTRRAVEGTLRCEQYLPGAYGDQDVAIFRR